MRYLAVAAAYFLLVALKASMQLAVVQSRYAAVPLISSCLAVTEVYVIASVAREGVGLVVVPIAIGGSFGCLAAMRFNSWRNRRQEKGPSHAQPNP